MRKLFMEKFGKEQREGSAEEVFYSDAYMDMLRTTVMGSKGLQN